MEAENMRALIHERMAELDRSMHKQQYTLYGKFSMGINATRFQGLPSWERFTRLRKPLVKKIWISAYLLVLMHRFFITPDILDRLLEAPAKTLLISFSTSLIYTLFFGIMFFFSTAFEVVKAEHEVRRLIYEDLLRELENSNVPSTV